MSNNLKSQTILNCKKVKQNEFAVKGSVSLDEEKQMNSVLSISCKVAIKDVASKTSEVSFEGNLYYDVIYLTKSGDIEHLNTIVAFASKFDGEQKLPYVEAFVTDTKFAFDMDKKVLNLESTVKAELFNTFAENVAEADTVDNVFVKTENKQIKCVTNVKNELFTILDDIVIAEKNATIVCACATTTVKNVDVQEKVVAVEFDVVRDVTYVYGEDKLVKMERKTQSCRQEFANTFGLKQVVVTIQKMSEKFSCEENEQGTCVTLVDIFDAKFFAVEEQNVKLLQDAFSETNELLLTRQSFEIDCFDEHFSYLDKISVNVKPLQDIQEIVCVPCVNVNIGACELVNEMLNVDGVVSADVVFKDANSSLNSTFVSAPFQTSFACASSAEKISVASQMRIIGQKTKRDNGIDLIFDGYFDVDLKKCDNVDFISNIDVGEIKQTDDAPISVYVCDDEDDFEVAKGLNVPPEQVSELMKNKKDKNYITLFKETKS